MDWWHKLKDNPLARWGAILLLVFYLSAIAADFIAPYDPYSSEADSSLLPPTRIYWTARGGENRGQWIGPHVYPTTQSSIDINTGERKLIENFNDPLPVRLFVQGTPYNFLQSRLPLPTKWDKATIFRGIPLSGRENPRRFLPIRLPLPSRWDEVTLFPGIPFDRHLFGVIGNGRINILGTDESGRDSFSRLLFGSRISLFIGLVGILISFPIGMLVGGISGYFGGWIDAISMRFVEVLMTIPTIYLLVALAAVLPAGLSSSQRFLLIVLITSFISWSGLARVIRGQVLSLKEQEFIQAARALGAKPLYIITRHVLPQTASYIVISATLAVPSFIVAESVLSLIGLGIQQPDPSWGNLLSLATNASIIVLQPWLIWPPALLIVLTVLAFNLLGDGLRDALDPRSLER